MSEATEAAAAKKPKAEVTLIKMDDGREVGFAGSRKMTKDILIDTGKIIEEGDTVTMQKGAVIVQIDFRNGKTVRSDIPVSLYARALGHGLSQKLGDEGAGEKEVDDAQMAIDELAKRLSEGEWDVEREAGGFSGASIVVKAIAEVKSLSVDVVKAYLDKKLADAKARGEKLTRQALYNSFRNPKAATYPVIKRMEEEKASKSSAVDADAELAAMGS